MQIKISDFAIRYSGTEEIVHPLSMVISPGEKIGIIGESGAGKSTFIKGLFGNIATSYYLSGEIQVSFEQDTTMPLFLTKKVSPRSSHHKKALLKNLRGSKIGMISQEPYSALSREHTIRQQLMDVLKLNGHNRQQCKELCDKIQQMVFFPPERLDANSEQLSGGECQRAAIAMAIAPLPDLLIADEPTTGLDLLIQKRFIHTLSEVLSRQPNMALLFVTHSLGLLNQVISGNGSIAVFYQGHLLEKFQLTSGSCLDRYLFAHHPYTIELLNNFLHHYFLHKNYFWDFYLNALPDNGWKPSTVCNGGCSFLSRCQLYQRMQSDGQFRDISQQCERTRPILEQTDGPFPSQQLACHVYKKIAESRLWKRFASLPVQVTNIASSLSNLNKRSSDKLSDSYQEILRVDHVSVGYRQWESILSDISFSIRNGQHLGIVGETGSGKSTLARTLSALAVHNQWVRGKILRQQNRQWFALAEMPASYQEQYHNLNQLIWQHPAEVFSSTEKLEQVLYDACEVWSKLWKLSETRQEKEKRICMTLRQLGLLTHVDQLPDLLRRFPEELSGGQRKRILLARSLLSCGYPHKMKTPHSRIMYIDEPLRGIDVVNKGVILACLQQAAEKINATLVVITHDLRVVRHLCKELLFLYRGYILETGPINEIVDSKVQMAENAAFHHPYTIDLVSSIPRLDHFWHKTDLADASQPPSQGCVYFPYCSRYKEICATKPAIASLCQNSMPELKKLPGMATQVACHAVWNSWQNATARLTNLDAWK